MTPPHLTSRVLELRTTLVVAQTADTVFDVVDQLVAYIKGSRSGEGRRPRDDSGFGSFKQKMAKKASFDGLSNEEAVSQRKE